MVEPIWCIWSDDGSFKPLPRHTKACDAAFVVGQHYVVDAQIPRDMRAHRAYFAEIRAVWMNLPPELAERFKSPEALRKYALVNTGHAYETARAFDTHDDAVKAAAFVSVLDEFAIVLVRDSVLMVARPKSQSVNDMGAEEFKRSKNDVLEFLARMIDVTREQLQTAAERDAA